MRVRAAPGVAGAAKKYRALGASWWVGRRWLPDKLLFVAAEKGTEHLMLRTPEGRTREAEGGTTPSVETVA